MFVYSVVLKILGVLHGGGKIISDYHVAASGNPLGSFFAPASIVFFA